MKKSVQIYFVALVVLIVLPASASAQLQTEFVSLRHPANFENGWIQIGEKIIGIDKIEETELEIEGEYLDVYKARLKGAKAKLYIARDDEEPTGEGVMLNANGVEYIGDNLKVQDGTSKVMHGHKVRQISGYLEADSGKRIRVRIGITESLLGGGSSELKIHGNKAILRGELGTRTYNQIFNLVYNYPSVKTLVLQDVPGSVNDEINMQTGRLVRMAGLRTHIPKGGQAHSGGVDLFCAGARRSLGKRAELGVHSWSGDSMSGNEDVEAASFPVNSPQHTAQINYFTEMLGNPTGKKFYFFTINAAPADGIHIMTAKEIRRFGLVTRK